MAAFPFDMVAFDLDGTLADTAPDLAAAVNHALAEMGRAAIDPESVRDLIGYGGRALLRKALAATGEVSDKFAESLTLPGDGSLDELVEQGFPIFLDFYGKNICLGTRAYPALEAAMDDLAARGVALAICTNKSERLSRMLVDALGWNGRFSAIVGADTLAVKKPDPLPLHEAVARAGGGCAAFVGDSITDADTARAAQMPFVAVSFGFSDRPVDTLGADAVIDSYVELIPALERLRRPTTRSPR